MCLERTKHDSTFKDKVRDIGYWYYVNDLVFDVFKKGNIYSCRVDKYNTMLEFSNNRKEEIDDLECTCSCHENVDNFCPHVYALVCHIFNIPKEESTLNVNQIRKYEKVGIKAIKKEFDKGNIDIIDLDFLGYNYDELFPDRNNDPLFDKLDKYIESMPFDILERAREKTIDEDGDTSILDKAINNKIAYQKKIEEEEKRERKRMRKVMFKGFIDGLFGVNDTPTKTDFNNDLSSWEKEELKKGNYEPWNFEEEELEEDDYYYEDDED